MAPTTTFRKIGTALDRALYIARQRAIGQISPGNIPVQWDDSYTRLNIINDLIAQNGYNSYLEIGCRDDSTFARVNADTKVGVDPVSGGTLRCTSDDFFAQNTQQFDLVFIDGLHTYEQVRMDILNTLRILNKGGMILLHDCLPLNAMAQLDRPMVDNWNGDVWKAFVEARTWPDVDAAVCMIDEGAGLLCHRPNTQPLAIQKGFKNLKFRLLREQYTELLRPLSYQEALKFAAK